MPSPNAAARMVFAGVRQPRGGASGTSQAQAWHAGGSGVDGGVVDGGVCRKAVDGAMVGRGVVDDVAPTVRSPLTMVAAYGLGTVWVMVVLPCGRCSATASAWPRTWARWHRVRGCHRCCGWHTAWARPCSLPSASASSLV